MKTTPKREVQANTIAPPLDTEKHWRCEEFDARTWILRGPEFRLMVFIQPDTKSSRIRAIGFETHSGIDLPAQQTVGGNFEVSFGGKLSGQIVIGIDGSVREPGSR